MVARAIKKSNATAVTMSSGDIKGFFSGTELRGAVLFVIPSDAGATVMDIGFEKRVLYCLVSGLKVTVRSDAISYSPADCGQAVIVAVMVPVEGTEFADNDEIISGGFCRKLSGR